ncbi:uncharacterized protein LOC127845316 isoform X3 [Dreissena polymorpha]|uniref:uncharacterized protein LOC127845316 isoform X3 n=1 Tax=Dreissena polymorpha TaxID=45954 RepID=UPI00226411E8|nr:uncharacterized protein LOC127845316 isoform X3 [Dreissena polymorpha]
MSFSRGNPRGRGFSQPSASYANAGSYYQYDNAEDEASYEYYENPTNADGEELQEGYECNPSYQYDYEQGQDYYEQDQYDNDGLVPEAYTDYQGYEYQEQEAGHESTSYAVDEAIAESEYNYESEQVGQQDYYSYSTHTPVTSDDHGSLVQEAHFSEERVLQQGTAYNPGRGVPQGPTAVNRGRSIGRSVPQVNLGRGFGTSAPPVNLGRGVGTSAPTVNRGRGVGSSATPFNQGRGVGTSAPTVNRGRGVGSSATPFNQGRGVGTSAPAVYRGRGVGSSATPFNQGKGVVSSASPVNQGRAVGTSAPPVNRGRGVVTVSPVSIGRGMGRAVVPQMNQGRKNVQETPTVNQDKGVVPQASIVNQGRGVVQQAPPVNQGRQGQVDNRSSSDGTLVASNQKGPSVHQPITELAKQGKSILENEKIKTGIVSGQFAEAMQKLVSSAPSAASSSTTIASSIQNKLQAISNKPFDASTVNTKPPSHLEVAPSSSMASEVNVDTDSDSNGEEDTGFCKYCQKKFESAKAYHAHTRGMQHTTLVMEAKAKKGDVRFQKEIVDKSVLEVQIPAPKPEPELAAEEETVENWMDLDDDTVKYIQERRDLNLRDLNPSEIGKNHLPDDYHCAICEIRCTGPLGFRSHLDGKQHRSNLDLAAKGVRLKSKKKVPTGIMMETKDFPAKIKKLIETSGETLAIVGLDFVTEFQTSDYKAAPRYVCNLCESKCDGSTIIPHVVGAKHRLNYFKHKHSDIYNHLTKYNSKKKKSEINTQCELFAKDIVAKEGQGEVKVKIELEASVDEDLQLTMRRESVALQEKAKDLRPIDQDEKTELAISQFREKRKSTEPSGSLSTKKKRPYHDNEARQEDESGDRRDPEYRRGEGRYHRYPEGRYSRYPDERYLDGHYPPDHRRGRYEPYYEHRSDPYDQTDFHASYRHMFDPYRMDDPYYEQRMLDERHRLDTLMEDRHRRQDPYEERRRVDDIVERRKYLDSLERDRLEDMIRRREQVTAREDPGEVDVDLLRLRRFEERERQLGRSRPGDAAVSESPSTEDRARLEAQIQRRDHMLHDQLPGMPLSSNPGIAKQQAEAAQILSEEAKKNPGVDVSRILANLSASMISSEDDAAMAMQISNALSQALLKYRLQSGTTEMSSANIPQRPIQPEPPMSSIPGFGDSTSNSTHVPAFLRQTNQQQPHNYSPTNQNLPYSTAQTSQNAYSSSSTNQNLYSSAPTNQQLSSKATSRFAFTVKSSGAAPVQPRNVLGQEQERSSSPPPENAKMPKNSAMYISSANPVEAQAPPVVNLTNVDQPQKQLLDSIRKQTEMLRQKLASLPGAKSATNTQPSSSSASSQVSPHSSEYFHNPGSVNSQAPSQVYSAAVTKAVPPSAYSKHYYQQNFHMAVPNSAPGLLQRAPQPNALSKISHLKPGGINK